jgi:hypothetical protein
MNFFKIIYFNSLILKLNDLIRLGLIKLIISSLTANKQLILITIKNNDIKHTQYLNFNK